MPNRRSPDGGCAARHLVRMLLCIPIPTMFRGGGSTCCAMPAGKPHSAAECRSPKFVEFRPRWTLSSSERPLKYIKRGIWDRNIFIRRRLKIRPHPVRSGSISRLQRVRKIAALYRCGEEYRLFCIYFPLEICFVGKLLYLCSGKEERCTFKNGRYEFALSLQRIGRDRLQRGRSPRIDKK